MSPEKIEKVVSMYREGVYLKDIAEETEISLPVIKRWLKANRAKYKLENRSKSHARRIDRSEIDAQSSPWNVGLSFLYLKSNWRSA